MVCDDFTIMEKAPTSSFFWLKAPFSAFTFKTLLRHYAKWEASPCKKQRNWDTNTKVIRKRGQAGWFVG